MQALINTKNNQFMVVLEKGHPIPDGLKWVQCDKSVTPWTHKFDGTKFVPLTPAECSELRPTHQTLPFDVR